MKEAPGVVKKLAPSGEKERSKKIFDDLQQKFSRKQLGEAAQEFAKSRDVRGKFSELMGGELSDRLDTDEFVNFVNTKFPETPKLKTFKTPTGQLQAFKTTKTGAEVVGGPIGGKKPPVTNTRSNLKSRIRALEREKISAVGRFQFTKEMETELQQIKGYLRDNFGEVFPEDVLGSAQGASAFDQYKR